MIKHLIFDFGDVFINLDKTATTRTLETHGMKDLHKDLVVLNQNYEMGLLDTTFFIAAYQKWFPKLTSSQIVHAWNAMLQDFPRYRLDFLEQLAAKKQYHLILLSNTNALHIQWIMENIPFYDTFKSYFDYFYLSHELQLRKPNPNIFEFVLDKHQLDPEATLFIDDTAENTVSASRLGIRVWNLDPKTEDVVDLFTLQKSLF